MVDAENYWPAVGLSQRFFLMVLPDGDKQLSLAMLSRGERLVYVVVGENDKVTACAVGEGGASSGPNLLPVAACDLGADPTAGRGQILLHRAGVWRGTLAVFDDQLRQTGEAVYEEVVRPSAAGDALDVRLSGGGHLPEPVELRLRTDGFLAHSAAGPLVGSYSLSGGRALAGVFHAPAQARRIWRREVASSDGTLKAVVHIVYRGGVRVGVQHGVLRFEPAA